MEQKVRKEQKRIRGRITDVFTVCDMPIIVNRGFAHIASIHDEWRFDISEPERIIKELKNLDLGAHLFTFSQRMPLTEPLFAFPYKWDNVAALPISTYDDWWRKFATQEARNKVRKARKTGVKVRLLEFSDELVKGIESIYNESPVRQGKAFPHYKKSFDELWRIHETYLDRSAFLGAFLGDELIGFAKLVDAGSFIKTFHIISKLAHRSKAPTNALIDEAVRFCCQKGTDFFVYGEFDWGKRGSIGLTQFKIDNGFQKIMLPKYYIPLTWLGTLILRTGLENGVVEKLPKHMVGSLLDLRRTLNKLRNFGRV